MMFFAWGIRTFSLKDFATKAKIASFSHYIIAYI